MTNTTEAREEAERRFPADHFHPLDRWRREIQIRDFLSGVEWAEGSTMTNEQVLAKVMEIVTWLGQHGYPGASEKVYYEFELPLTLGAEPGVPVSDGSL